MLHFVRGTQINLGLKHAVSILFTITAWFIYRNTNLASMFETQA